MVMPAYIPDMGNGTLFQGDKSRISHGVSEHSFQIIAVLKGPGGVFADFSSDRADHKQQRGIWRESVLGGCFSICRAIFDQKNRIAQGIHFGFYLPVFL
jgi:hypothetical protein